MSASAMRMSPQSRQPFHLHQQKDKKKPPFLKNDQANQKRSHACESIDSKLFYESEGVFESLKAVHLHLRFNLDFEQEYDAEAMKDQEEIFEEDEIICSTRNRGKKSELDKYVAVHLKPRVISSELSEKLFFKKNEKILLSPVPIDQGKCAGAVALFLKQMLKTGDIEGRAAKFAEGVPFKAAVLQDMLTKSADFNDELIHLFYMSYELFPDLSYEEVLETALDTYKDIYDEDYSGVSLPLCEQMHRYFSQGGNVKDGDFIAHMISNLGNVKSEEMCVDLHALQFLATDEDKENFVTAIYNTYALDRHVVHKKCPDAREEDIVGTLDGLTEGAYEIGLLVYKSNGDCIGGHALGCVIQKEGTVILYDPNFAIAAVRDVRSTVIKLLNYYSHPSISNPYSSFSLSKISLLRT